MDCSQITLNRIYEETGIKYDHLFMANWANISMHQTLSEEFMREFYKKLEWGNICMYQMLSENFMEEFKHKINWDLISEYQKLSEDFIRKFQDKVNWYSISAYQKLSEDFMKEFKDMLKWGGASEYQKLSENFIREFKLQVDWDCISKQQKLSEDFIREFKDFVNWENIQDYQKISKEFKKEFNLEIGSYSWLYKDTEFKKNEIIKSGLYDCYDDYFIAYKNIRKDRYSHFNFQYQYLKGETYECHCDCTSSNCSFGLSVWTKPKAEYFNPFGMIIEVKVKYEDIGRIINGYDGKIRCFKFEVLD